MHEIIYSVFHNDYVIRDVFSVVSTIEPLFIGTYQECIIKLAKIKGAYTK